MLIAALMGVLASGALASTMAQEIKDRKHNSVVALDGPRPHEPLPRLTETRIDAAIRTMFCQEARAAVNRGRLGPPERQWVLAHGHRCRDAHLLFDGWGF